MIQNTVYLENAELTKNFKTFFFFFCKTPQYEYNNVQNKSSTGNGTVNFSQINLVTKPLFPRAVLSKRNIYLQYLYSKPHIK